MIEEFDSIQKNVQTNVKKRKHEDMNTPKKAASNERIMTKHVVNTEPNVIRTLDVLVPNKPRELNINDWTRKVNFNATKLVKPLFPQPNGKSNIRLVKKKDTLVGDLNLEAMNAPSPKRPKIFLKLIKDPKSGGILTTNHKSISELPDEVDSLTRISEANEYAASTATTTNCATDSASFSEHSSKTVPNILSHGAGNLPVSDL